MSFHCKIVVEDNTRKYLVTFSYEELMTERSRMPLFDLKKLIASLPVASVPNLSTHVLVMGAADDFVLVNITYILYKGIMTAVIY